MLIRIGAAVLAAAAVVAILTLLLGPVTSWAGGAAVRHLSGKEKADAINGVRQTLLQASAGTVALAVLVFTGLTFGLNRRGQVTDRYTKAISLLASEKLDERIGGIYALEHVMIESELDHETVVQVLAAFVREHAAIDTTRASLWIDPPLRQGGGQASRKPQPMADTQTALTVLGRRPTRNENQPLDLSRSDLRGADLRGANLERAELGGTHLEDARLQGAHLKVTYLFEAHLERANLEEAHFEGSGLSGAHFEGADLCGAHFEGADLSGAHLEEAFLSGANLERADLSGAHLEGAFLSGANLERAGLSGAHFEGTDLSGVENLTRSQIEYAVVNAQTVLPSYLAPKHGGSSPMESSS